jgi:hypothetical protein
MKNNNKAPSFLKQEHKEIYLSNTNDNLVVESMFACIIFILAIIVIYLYFSLKYKSKIQYINIMIDKILSSLEYNNLCLDIPRLLSSDINYMCDHCIDSDGAISLLVLAYVNKIHTSKQLHIFIMELIQQKHIILSNLKYKNIHSVKQDIDIITQHVLFNLEICKTNKDIDKYFHGSK